MSSSQLVVDHDFIDEHDLPNVYSSEDILGFGHSGTVERVKDLRSGVLYARKTIRITGTIYDRREQARVFQNEVRIIRGLECHCHIIKVHATYWTQRTFGLVLNPVASHRDLEDFIQRYYEARRSDMTQEVADMAAVLERAFGCLAAGLAFMHGKRIRHKDIKPRNILVHAGKMIYTDFGYSFDSNGLTHSATSGRPEHFTKRYSCPEVLHNMERNSKSDVFSLGCVYMDILFALADQGIPVPGRECFANIVENLHQQVLHIGLSPRLEILPRIIVRMTSPASSDRLCSAHVAAKLLQQPQHGCQECASSPVENWIARVQDDQCLIANTLLNIIYLEEHIDDNATPLHELFRITIQDLDDATSTNNGWACGRDNKIASQVFNLTTRLSNWRTSIVYTSRPDLAPGTVTSSEDDAVDEFLQLLSRERPLVSSLVHKFLSDILHRLNLLKTCVRVESPNYDSDTANTLLELLETSVGCLCLQLEPIAALTLR